MARLPGVIVRHPSSTLGIQDDSGVVRAVVWDFGFSVRDDENTLALVDSHGVIIAHEGDRVALGGYDNGSAWINCGGVQPGG